MLCSIWFSTRLSSEKNEASPFPASCPRLGQASFWGHPWPDCSKNLAKSVQQESPDLGYLIKVYSLTLNNKVLVLPLVSILLSQSGKTLSTLNFPPSSFISLTPALSIKPHPQLLSLLQSSVQSFFCYLLFIYFIQMTEGQRQRGVGGERGRQTTGKEVF